MTVLIGTETVQVTTFAPAVGTLCGQQLECTVEGLLEEIHIHGNPSAGTGAPWVAVWSDNAGSPGTLLAKGKATSIPEANVWYAVKLTVPLKITKGTKYWLGGMTSTGTFRLVGLTAGSNVTLKESVKSTFTEPGETTEWSGKAKGPISIYGTGSTPSIALASVSGAGAVSVPSIKTIRQIALASVSGAGDGTAFKPGVSLAKISGGGAVTASVSTKRIVPLASVRGGGNSQVEPQTYGLPQVYAFGEPGAGSAYRVVQPYKAATPGSPIIVYLHESGSDEPNTEQVGNVFPRPGETLFAIRPEGQGGNGRQFSTTGYAENANENGFCCFVPGYRPITEGRAGNVDLEQLFVWIKQHAAAWNGDPTQICIIGGSFGATIGFYEALKLNHEHNNHRYIVAVAGLSGPVDIPSRIQGRAEEVIATEKWESEHPGFTTEQLRKWEEENHIDNTNTVVSKLGKYMGLSSTQITHLKESGWLKGPSAEQKEILKLAEELSAPYEVNAENETMPYIWYAVSGNDQTPQQQGEEMSEAAALHGQPGKYHFNASIEAGHGFSYYSTVRSEIYSFFRQAINPAVINTVAVTGAGTDTASVSTIRKLSLAQVSGGGAASITSAKTIRKISLVSCTGTGKIVAIGPGVSPVVTGGGNPFAVASTIRKVAVAAVHGGGSTSVVSNSRRLVRVASCTGGGNTSALAGPTRHTTMVLPLSPGSTTVVLPQ